ncbi:hypothetical protein EII17_09375 [Clostridiales bacterium COT073_COT-073]|nr:hypothetical protein EII17_09375 [Clostridiales bacterium COT073_COT-073]
MKKIRCLLIAFVIAFGISGCTQEEKEATIINTYEKTSENEIEKNIDNAEQIIMVTYYEMSDGTWKTDDYNYQYKLVLTGRIKSAVKDTCYTILSNQKSITFDMAVKASGFSSNIEDYFKEEDAVIVAIQ